jgi:peroxiredoxin
MNRLFHILSPSLILTACLTSALGQEPGNPVPVPRFRLEVGQELRYAFEFPYKNPDGSLLIERTDWTFWIMDATGDGSWQVVVRQSTSYAKENEPAPAVGEPGNQTSLASCKLYSDGRTVPTSRLMPRIEIASVFPRLPADAREARKGWEIDDDRNDIKNHSRMRNAVDRTEAIIETSTEGPLERVYLGSGKSTIFHIDRTRGLVVQAEVGSPFAYGQTGRASGTIRLKGVDRHEAEWLKVLRDEADRYFKAESTYLDLLAKAKHAGRGLGDPVPAEPKGPIARFLRANLVRVETRKRLAEAKDVLVAARERVTLPMLRESLDLWVKNHQQLGNSDVEEAVKWDEIRGRPAPDWELKDLQGRPHAMKDYRDRIVLLDFWYRNCPWCLRAVPQILGVARHFEGRPVAVLGMNIDEDRADAQYVVDKLGITYPVLRATGDLTRGYGASYFGFPTLVIIDRDGIVRDLHVGYSDTLREDVVKAVQALLDERAEK